MYQKTLFESDTFRLVDNRQDYDFVGYVENLGKEGTLVVVFSTTEPEYHEEYEDFFWEEDSWSVEDIVTVKDDKYIKQIQDMVEENASCPNFLQMITVQPQEWSGFLADNKGRSMFNALRKIITNVQNY